MRARFKR